MNEGTDNKSVMIVAGEASGDLHGSMLVKEMFQRDNALSFYGVGGKAMKDAGVEILVDAETLSVVGITEVIPKLPTVFRSMRTVKQALKKMRPDLLVLIDYPDFNLRIAPYAKKLGIPVLYYVSPQIWAWRSGRVKKIKKCVDHMAVILPFEADFYRKYDVPVTFIGHPLFDERVFPSREDIESKKDEPPVIGLLPGSRIGELSRHLPIMLDTAGEIASRLGDVKFALSLAPSIKKSFMEELITGHPEASRIEIVSGGAEKVILQSRMVIAVSGTVTLEIGLFGMPMVVIYKVSPISYRIGRALIQVKNISIVNLIAGKTIVPELIQHEANPVNIADEACKIFQDAALLKTLRSELLDVRGALGGPGASGRLAEIAIGML
ncbi:MAG: lipid-A-disaccharide synthase [Desulfobacterales bacterium]|nr:lipid-A-disaccharide synthase [Desulfobacterales bacterium]